MARLCRQSRLDKKIEKRKSSKKDKLVFQEIEKDIPLPSLPPCDKKDSIKKLESEVLDSKELSDAIAETDQEEEQEKASGLRARDTLEQIMFSLPCVSEPLIGTPKQVQPELDGLVKKMQKQPTDNVIFNKIHLYMHGYLINVVLKKFPFIKGLQTADIYQETLIALRFKAIPNFRNDRGMSFLNFAKMCIRRHLITKLNISKNRKKDQSMNQAISIDSTLTGKNDDSEEERGTLANIIGDKKPAVDEAMETNEAFEVTKSALFRELSDFEKIVLREYLTSGTYREISKSISRNLAHRYNTKSIDNALLRIRKKAILLKKNGKLEDIPIFLPKR